MKIKKWIIRLCFLVFLAAAVFGVEYFIYRYAPTEKASAESLKSKKRILIAGGSLANNIEGGMRSYLYDQKLDDKYSISSFITAMPESTVFLSGFNKLLTTYNPQVVYLMIGMDENKKNVGINDQKLYAETEINLTTLAQQEKKEEFNAVLIRQAQYFYEKADKYALRDFRYFLMLPLFKEKEIFDADKIVSFVIQKVISQQQNQGRCQQCLFALVAMAKDLERDPPWQLFGLSPTQILAHPEKREKYFQIFKKNFNAFVNDGAKKLQQMGPRKFLNDESFFTFLDRAWLVESWPNKKIKTPPATYYDKNLGYLLAYLKMIYPLKGMAPFDSLYPLYSVGAPFYEKLAHIKEICDEKKVTLILLQYPNTHRNYIDRAGRDLGALVINGQKSFEGIVTESNREMYFQDKVGDSGHMTSLGAALFGKSIILQSPTIFPEINRGK